MQANQKVGRLTLLEPVVSTSPLKWRCRCECGTVKSISEANLKYGRTKSCGCLRTQAKHRLMSSAFPSRSPA